MAGKRGTAAVRNGRNERLMRAEARAMALGLPLPLLRRKVADMIFMRYDPAIVQEYQNVLSERESRRDG